MKIKSVVLKDFKRFTDLTIQDLPETARLVVLVGPNGSGKSSLFEAFNVYTHRARDNNMSDTDYWRKVGLSPSLIALNNPKASIWSLYGNNVKVDFHGFGWEQVTAQSGTDDFNKKFFYIRTSYRHEGDFSVTSISKIGDLLDDPQRPAYMFSQESRVSANYQRMVALTLKEVYDQSLDQNTPRSEIRDRLIKQIGESLQRVLPDLQLLGPGDPVEDGTFFFQKGTARDWKYKNLSGGERAAFDLLLDFAVKVHRFDDTVYCIDEPEVHMHTGVQAALLEEMLGLLPSSCQLWIATHSAGMMRAARDMSARQPGHVAFLDFGGQNFDELVVMRPSIPDRAFWKRNFEVALGDMAHLVAPSHIVFCESNSKDSGDGSGFDAQCFEAIFAQEFPDTEFVSVGGTSDLQKNALSVSAVMERVLSGVKFTIVRDRDDASENEIKEWETQGLRVLSRRTIESYLWDDEILERLCDSLGQPDAVEEVKNLKAHEMKAVRERGNPADDVKSAAGNLYAQLRKILDTRGKGSTRQAFSRDTLAPLITPDTQVYQELKRDIFG